MMQYKVLVRQYCLRVAQCTGSIVNDIHPPWSGATSFPALLNDEIHPLDCVIEEAGAQLLIRKVLTKEANGVPDILQTAEMWQCQTATEPQARTA